MRGTTQELLAAIVDSSDDAIISKDLSGVIQTCNAAAERLFGYSKDELIGRPVTILIPPDRQHEEVDILRRIRGGERIVHFETIRLAKGGRPIDVSLTISPIRDAAGTIVGASKIARDISEQKTASEAQSYLAAIVESTDDAIVSKDLNGIIRWCNPAAERMFGYDASELVGQSVRILIPSDRQAEEDEILARVRSGERVRHYETVRLTKNGEPRDVSLTVSPVLDRAGNIIGVSKVARDITREKRLAAELIAQKEWFRVTLESIGDGVMASDTHGRLTYMNETAEELSGWTLAEAQGKSLDEVFRIVNEKTRRPVDHPAAVVMRTGKIVGLANHTVLISRNGTERPIADSAAPIYHGGAIEGVVLVFRDVAQERRAENALAEQREWLETTLRSIGDAVIATDVQGRVVFMNAIAERLTGWHIDRARQRPCTEVFKIVSEDTRRAVENPVSKVLAAGSVVGLANHTVLISADGSEHPIDDSGAPIRDADGRVAGVVLVFRDVTERRRVEAERREAAADRERLLESERAARAEAERASRVKDEFVAMVSHELRTPLNAILGWTQLMASQTSDPAIVARGVEVVIRNTRAQAQLISDLLDVSRIAAGKLRLDMQNVRLDEIVRDAIETVVPEARAKGVTIESHVDEEVGTAAGDSARLQQIVWNLMSNAIKFTPAAGRVTITLRCAGSDAEIVVADTGAGIPREFLPHVFDRFQQADRSITRRFGGLGLGLAIVKHLAELHGGHVRAESDGEGKGSTFTVFLPASAGCPAPARPEASRGVAVDHAPAVSLDGLRVLVVEDDDDTREFLKRLLESHGAGVTAVANAKQALDAFARGAPEVMVSDIGLPEIDGFELMQRVRQLANDAAQGVPAIALTAFARAEDRTRALRAGYQAHLAKPVESAELLATIASFAELIERRRR